MIKTNDPIYVAGHKGLLGSAIIKKLIKYKFKNILTIEKKKIKFNRSKKNFSIFERKKT